MSDLLKLDGNGNCPNCNQASIEGEHVKCYSCKELFHAVCNNATQEMKLANKTTINHFLLPSTKNNFVFYCDRCLTQNEIRQTESNEARIDNLEDKASLCSMLILNLQSEYVISIQCETKYFL